MRHTAPTGDRPASHQTVKLARGRHSSPAEGVCVMELASMLADEPFSDRPQSVSPVIGAFLRAYNDRLDDRLRDDLYLYAANIVGTRGTIDVERRRTQMCRDWIQQTKAHGALPEEPLGSQSRPGRLRERLQSFGKERVAHRAAIAFDRRGLRSGGHEPDYEVHRAALRFVDRLIAAGGNDTPEPRDLQELSGENPRAGTQ
ncbi:MAG TPA: hypothetical protein VFL87_07295 [Thermoleophilaceae bacterium]|nr:hypothetical protein [Thermoleophilaceae bacterium]